MIRGNIIVNIMPRRAFPVLIRAPGMIIRSGGIRSGSILLRSHTVCLLRQSNQFTTSGRRYLQSDDKLHSRLNNDKKSDEKEEKGIKKLMKTYGYSALIVYIGITFVSLPLCLFTVHSFGEERMLVLMNRVKRVFGYGEVDEDAVREKLREKERIRSEKLEGDETRGSVWARMKNSPLLAEFIIAYGLHKSLIFVRIPLTAAITPSMARILRNLGFTRLVGNNPLGSVQGQAGSNLNSKYSNLSPNGVDVPRQTRTRGRKWFNGLF